MVASWIVPLVLVAAFAVLLLAPLLETLLSPRRSVCFYCGFVDRHVTARFSEPSACGIRGRADVVACSAFEKPEAVTCGKHCLQMELWRR